MFTGIVKAIGEVIDLKKTGTMNHLRVKSGPISADAAVGDSISINGVCLTVTSIDNDIMSFDVSEETMRRTNLGELKSGDPVNLEPALRPTDRLGGHLVTGHIDSTGRIRSIRPLGDAKEIEIEAPESVMKYIIEKGSIAIDGISLTVNTVKSDSFTVVIIPHTAEVTTIGNKQVNDKVNLETDIIGKYVYKFIESKGTDTKDERLMKKLSEAGFI